MAANTPENKVKTAIKRWLTERGIYYFSAAAGPFSVHGVPDIIVCYKGLFIGIEVKAPGKENNLTPNQRQHLDRINSSGGIAFVASSVQTVQRRLSSLDADAFPP